MRKPVRCSCSAAFVNYFKQMFDSSDLGVVRFQGSDVWSVLIRYFKKFKNLMNKNLMWLKFYFFIALRLARDRLIHPSGDIGQKFE